MGKKIILLSFLLIALMVSGCFWYGGHGSGYYRYYDHHDRDGWDRHHHGGEHHRR